MAYIPKSKYTVLETPGNELKIQGTSQVYKGPYIKTSNNKYYTGTTSLPLGARLVKIELVSANVSRKPFIKSASVKIHNILKKRTKLTLENTLPIIFSKTRPTKFDYNRGYYNRFFSKIINNNSNYKEISKEIYLAIINKNVKYDYNLNQVGTIQWFITGNVFKLNANSLGNLSSKFTNLSSIFPFLNEFQKIDLQVQENLLAKPLELYYSDGTEYIGLYHIHPEKGPMEGPTHVMTSHKSLYYTLPYPHPLSNYNNFLSQKYDKFNPDPTLRDDYGERNTLPETPIITPPTTTIGPSSTSGGGGGGY